MSSDEIKKKVVGRRRRRGRRRYPASRPLSRALFLSQGAANQQAPLVDPTGRPHFRPPGAALAVLKRARETAAAAAQAAADAAVLIEGSRAEGQMWFNEFRGFGLPPPFRRNRRNRRRVRGGRTDETSKQTDTSKSEEEPKKNPRRRKTMSYWARRRARMARRRAQGIVDPYLHHRPPVEPYSFATEPYPRVADEYPGMVGYRGYEWQDLEAGPDPGFIPPADRFAGPSDARYAASRNDEFLAQARALIHAQNEQMNPGYRVPYEPWSCPDPYMPGENREPRSHLRSSRW